MEVGAIVIVALVVLWLLDRAASLGATRRPEKPVNPTRIPLSSAALPERLDSPANGRPNSAVLSLPWLEGQCIYDPRYQSHDRFIYLWIPSTSDVVRITLSDYIDLHGFSAEVMTTARLNAQHYQAYQGWLKEGIREANLDFPYMLSDITYPIEHRQVITSAPSPVAEALERLNKLDEFGPSVPSTGRGPRGYCTRCGGTGYIPHFNHVQGGVCFACFGRG